MKEKRTRQRRQRQRRNIVCICVHAHLILMMIALTSLRSLNVFSAVQFLCNTHIHNVNRATSFASFSLCLSLFGLHACIAMQSQTHCVTVCRYCLRAVFSLFLAHSLSLPGILLCLHRLVFGFGTKESTNDLNIFGL